MLKIEKNKRVLFIDDEEVFNFMAESIIELSGVDWAFDSVTSGQEALDFLQDSGEKFPNVILVDINMPLMNGWGFVEAYNKLNFKEAGQTYMAILTSSDNPLDKRKAKELNIAFYIKPVDIESIKVIDLNIEKFNDAKKSI
ncbi:MAG: response regulator [Flavobacteriales bacterium]|nr:response regulator [Flavobacteriales bacterium]